MRGNGAVLVALGASTAVGRDALSTAAAARAGVAGFAEHPYMIDTAGEPMRVALAPWLDIDCEPADRFEALLLPAIEQALEPIQAADSGLRVAVALALPAPRPGLPADLERTLRTSITNRFPNRFAGFATFAVGHAGGILGMRAALTKMADGAYDACILAGVESYISPETLEWIEQNDQLHSAGRLNNAWGFIPGEAAGAALLLTENAASRLRASVLGRVLSVAVAVEPNAIKTRTVCIGEGLTAAFREALSGLPSGAQVTDVYCDMNGEPYRADEFGFACVRTKEAFVSASNFIASADCWGDVSSASVPLALVQATVAAQKTYANGAYTLIWASSEGGERGAVLLEFPFSPAT